MAFSSNDGSSLLAHMLPATALLFDNSGAVVSLFDDQDRLICTTGSGQGSTGYLFEVIKEVLKLKETALGRWRLLFNLP
ncbi:hypothetical protein ACT3R4_17430 [Halomonas sp. AOP7-E1-9]